MSLINEALKRTRDTAPNAGVPAPVGAKYRIESKVESSGTKGNFFVTILIAGMVLVGLIVLGSRIAQRVQTVQEGFGSNTDAPAVDAKPTSPVSKPATEPALMSDVLSKAEATPPSAPAPIAGTKSIEDQIVTKVMERVKAEQGAIPRTASTDQPKLVLQGITYAKDGSDAMINDQTVHEGDEINGARVVTIENRRVKLDFNGREIILRLP